MPIPSQNDFLLPFVQFLRNRRSAVLAKGCLTTPAAGQPVPSYFPKVLEAECGARKIAGDALFSGETGCHV